MTHEKSRLNLSLKSEIRGLKAELLETSNLRENQKIEIDTLSIDYQDLLQSLKSQIDTIISSHSRSPKSYSSHYSPSNLSTDSKNSILQTPSHSPFTPDPSHYHSPKNPHKNPDNPNPLPHTIETPRFIDYHNTNSSRIILEALQKSIEKIQASYKEATKTKKKLQSKISEMEEIIASNDSNLENKRLFSKNSEQENQILTLKDKISLLRDEIRSGSGLEL